MARWAEITAERGGSVSDSVQRVRHFGVGVGGRRVEVVLCEVYALENGRPKDSHFIKRS